MALAYKDQKGYLLVNTDLTGSDTSSQCDGQSPESCQEGNDGCHPVGWWHREVRSQCSSGLGCAIDQSNRYGNVWNRCSGDVTTNNAGTTGWSSGSSKAADHTVWLFVRPAQSA